METGRKKIDFNNNIVDTAKILLFLKEQVSSNPTKRNIKRLEMFMDIIEGYSLWELSEKYNIKTKEPSNYFSKILNRFASYAGVENYFGIRAVREGVDGLSTF